MLVVVWETTNNAWCAGPLQQPMDSQNSADEQYVLIAVRYRSQILEKIKAPLSVALDFDAAGLTPPSYDLSATVEETPLRVLSSAEIRCALMSLQV